MTTSIFVNLPSTDLERSKKFYTALGFTINPMFTDENAACVVLDENIYFMVLTREYLGTFTDKQIIDPKTHAQTSISFTRDSRDIEDPDGNILGFVYMDQAAVEKGPEAYLAEQGVAQASA